MYKKILIIGMVLSMALLGAFALDLNVNDDRKIENGIIEDDYLFAGKSLEFSGTTDNLYAFAERVVVTGNADGGMITTGRDVEITGVVGNDAIIAAENVLINGTINGSLFLAGADIIIDNGSVINGDIFATGGRVTVKGTVNGDMYTAGGTFRIDGTVEGNVKASIGELELGDGARINGNFWYQSDYKLSASDKEKIRGTVEFEELKGRKPHYQKWDNRHNAPGRGGFAGFRMVMAIIISITLLIGGLLLLSFPLFKKLEENDKTIKEFWFTGLWGLIPFFLFPVLVIVLIGLGITTPIGLIVFFAGLPLLFATHVIGATLLGQFLFKLFRIQNNRRHVQFLFGSLFFTTLLMVPFVHFFTFIFVSALGWGVFLEGLFRRKLVA